MRFRDKRNSEMLSVCSLWLHLSQNLNRYYPDGTISICEWAGKYIWMQNRQLFFFAEVPTEFVQKSVGIVCGVFLQDENDVECEAFQLFICCCIPSFEWDACSVLTSKKTKQEVVVVSSLGRLSQTRTTRFQGNNRKSKGTVVNGIKLNWICVHSISGPT